MNNKLIAWGMAVAGVLVKPVLALAGPNDPSREIVDARYEGYASNVSLPASSTATSWMLLVVLGIICCAALFLNARRTHLD